MKQVLQAAFEPNQRANPKSYMPFIRRGRVINVNQAGPTVDVAMMDGSGVYKNVPISSDAVSTIGGKSYTPSPIKPNSNDALPTGYGKRDVFAIVAFLDGIGTMPIVIGFMRPNFHQLSFSGAGFENHCMDRHDSDRYHRVWGDAASGVPCQEELYWPDGSYMKISAESTSLANLSGANQDAAKTPFAVKNNDPAKTFFFKHSSGTVFQIEAGGAVSVQLSSGATLTMSGNQLSISAPGNLEVTAPTAQFSGDVVAGAISLQNHTHSGVQPGSGDSGPPIGGGGNESSSVSANQKSWMGIV